MHKFAIYPEDSGVGPFDLAEAYLVGADGVPVRGECRLDGNLIICESRNTDPLGLSLLWTVRDFGTIQLETTRLPARPAPYNLHIELVRHRLLRISVKLEEWGLFGYPGMEQIAAQIDHARNVFINALKMVHEPPQAARLADEALRLACEASVRVCEFHAGVFLARRRSAGGFKRPYLGAALAPTKNAPALRDPLGSVFDFVRVPFVWREIHRKEQRTSYDQSDRLVRAALKVHLGVRGGPLLSFGVRFVPDWLYIWENDYEAIADFAREHIRRTVKRYAGKVSHWIVASGLHADSVFPFNFEQIMDLTRMAASTTKQADPRAQVVVDIVQPWGEYFARNQATIPPSLYAEMIVQSGIPFDALGLQFVFGIEADGFHLRDLMQISSLIDRFANYGKPIHITAVSVPTQPCTGGMLAEVWSPQTQGQWLAQFTRVALSKPYVDSVCLYGLTDAGAVGVPGGGLLRDDGQPTEALSALAELRRALDTKG